MVQVRDFNFASVTFDHEPKKFFVVRNFAGLVDLSFLRTFRILFGSFLPKKFQAEEFILVLAHSHFLSRKTRFNTHHFDADVAISFDAGLECGESGEHEVSTEHVVLYVGLAR